MIELKEDEDVKGEEGAEKDNAVVMRKDRLECFTSHYLDEVQCNTKKVCWE